MDLSNPREPSVLSLEGLLNAYRHGFFPMSERIDDPGIFWCSPDPRGIFPLNGLHIGKSLAKTIRKNPFDVRLDHAFAAVIEACATTPRLSAELGAGADGQNADSWINAPIKAAFIALHRKGLAHSVECWQDGRLVGGLYGLALGGAFFGESMFARVDNASKVALVHLVARLNAGGFILLDTQYVTPHLASLGALEVPREAYLDLLQKACPLHADFWRLDLASHESPDVVLDLARP